MRVGSQSIKSRWDSLEDYSITSPERLLNCFKRLTPVPRVVVIASKSETTKLAELTGASEVAWGFDPLYVGRVESREIGFVPQGVGAPATAFLVTQEGKCRC